MSRKFGPSVRFRVIEISTVDKQWYSRYGRQSHPTCANCGKYQRPPEALLITLHRLPADTLVGWFCESCARKRNLLW